MNLDVTQHTPGQLQAWLLEHFRNAPRLPDLDGAGFHPVDARLLVTDSGPAAMGLYQSAQGGAISFYIRPPSPSHGVLPRGQRRDRQLVATYWSGNGCNYALVSPANATEVRAIREAAFQPSIRRAGRIAACGFLAVCLALPTPVSTPCSASTFRC